MEKVFLDAQWTNLVMANFEVDPNLLKEYVPMYTELDYFEEKCYVSLVGFMFENTKMLGMKIPFHVNFEEVNLRFYVKHKVNNEWRRGVVFIKEIVPKPAITFVANKLYNENYETMPMSHSKVLADGKMTVTYFWGEEKNTISFTTNQKKYALEKGSAAEFITEHYWGYAKAKDHTVEYAVEHPPWNIYEMLECRLECEFGKVYGKKFEFLEKQKPSSVFMAEGSEIIVRKGVKLTGKAQF